MAAIGVNATAAGAVLCEQQALASDEDVFEKEKKMKELKERLMGSEENLLEKLIQGGEFRENEEPNGDPFLMRWLAARSWNVEKAVKAIIRHANWRLQFCPEGRIKESEIPNQLAANKVFLQGTDKAGRGVMIVLAARHDAWYGNPQEVLQMMCYGLDAVLDAADVSTNPGRKTCSIFDLSNIGFSNFDIATANTVYDMLAHHFVERLGILFIYNAPSIFWAAWTAFKTVIPEVTMERIKFVYPDDISIFQKYIDPKVLPKAYGGDAEYIPVEDAVAKMPKGN